MRFEMLNKMFVGCGTFFYYEEHKSLKSLYGNRYFKKILYKSIPNYYNEKNSITIFKFVTHFSN